MIPAAKSRAFSAWFAWDCERRIRRTFGRVYVQGLEVLARELSLRPVLVVSNHTSWWDPLVVLCAGGLILGLGGVDNGRAGVFGSKAGVYLGEISYSIYMVCAPVLLLGVNVAARLTGAEDKKLHVIVWLAVLAAVPVAAALTYHLVERPARKALRGLAARNGSASRDVAPEANSPERVLQPSKTIV